MVPFGIEVLFIIKCLKLAYPGIIPPGYADDSGALGTFYKLEISFNQFKCTGLDQVYYPKPTKRILIVHPKNIESGALFGASRGFGV